LKYYALDARIKEYFEIVFRITTIYAKCVMGWCTNFSEFLNVYMYRNITKYTSFELTAIISLRLKRKKGSHSYKKLFVLLYYFLLLKHLKNIVYIYKCNYRIIFLLNIFQYFICWCNTLKSLQWITLTNSNCNFFKIFECW
jgi:hypothetical protein